MTLGLSKNVLTASPCGRILQVGAQVDFYITSLLLSLSGDCDRYEVFGLVYKNQGSIPSPTSNKTTIENDYSSKISG